LTKAGRAAVRHAPRLAQERLIEAVDLLPLPQRAALAEGLVRLVEQLGLGAARPRMFFEEGVAGAE